MNSKEICERFIRAGEMLLAAAELVKGDDIRVDMIKHLHPDFLRLMVWHEGVLSLLANPSYEHAIQRDELLHEMDTHGREIEALASKIMDILLPLERVTVA